MQHANNSENSRQSWAKKDQTRSNSVQKQTLWETTTDLTSCLSHATFERYSVDNKMYDTCSKHIEGAKGIKT